MVEIEPLSPNLAAKFESWLGDESSDYLQYFLAFRDAGALVEATVQARQDRFWSIGQDGTPCAVFFLRGFDAGYRLPSFGVYVRSAYAGRGYARRAMIYAVDWARTEGTAQIMLKVAPEHTMALEMYRRHGFEPVGHCPDIGHVMMVLALFQ